MKRKTLLRDRIVQHLHRPRRLLLYLSAAACLCGCHSPQTGDAWPRHADPRRFRLALDKQAADLYLSDKLTPPLEMLKSIHSQRAAISVARPSQRKKAPPRRYRELLPSSCVVSTVRACKNEKCSIRAHASVASGAFLTKDGALVTNYHVVDKTNAVGIVVTTADGSVFPVTDIMAVDPVQDVAIIQSTATNVIPVGVADTHPPIGSPISVVSNPRTGYFAYSEGAVSSYQRIKEKSNNETQEPEERTLMCVTADFAVGSSGGPVVDCAGNLVGIVCSTRSVYTRSRKRKGDQRQLQMVWKLCIPVEAIKALIAPDD